MVQKSITCPNCRGPVQPDPSSPTVSCGYCNHHFENPVYKKTRPQRQVATAAKTSRNIVLLFVLPSIISIVVFVVIGVVFAVRSSLTAVSPIIEITSSGLPTARPTQPTQVVLPEVMLEQKLDKYIDCLDRAFPRAKQSMERYRSWVNVIKGPTCKERYVSWGLYAMYDDAPKRCHEYIGEANAAEPQIPGLHQAAVQFVTAAASLEPVTKAASEYYDKSMYKVDDCVKGKQFHPQLVSLYDNLLQKYQILRQNIEHYGRGVLDRCLARTAALPDAAAAHQWAALIKTGGGMIEAFRAEAKKKKPNLEVIKSQIDALTQAQSALDAMSDRHKAAAGYHWSHKSDIDEFVEGAVAFLSSQGGKKLGHTARFFRRNGTHLRQLEGTFENLVVRYNEVLEDYSQNKFCGSLLPCDDTRCPVR